MFCNSSIFHHWEHWTVTSKGEIHRRSSIRGQPVEGSNRVVGNYVEQSRKCLMCGLTQIKRTETGK